ncbi:uncharacterized protein Dmul_04060 [Desulfococcus multivorans]|nr:uncharacterized protein Dmul_04060 [Desulfococcus multivorans]
MDIRSFVQTVVEAPPGKNICIGFSDLFYFFKIEQPLTIGESMKRHDPDERLIRGFFRLVVCREHIFRLRNRIVFFFVHLASSIFTERMKCRDKLSKNGLN